MIEWAAFFAAIDKVFVIAIAVIGFFIKKALSNQADTNDRLEKMSKEILKQVNATNGRLLVLEEWKRSHEKASDEAHLALWDNVKSTEKRFEEYILNKNIRH